MPVDDWVVAFVELELEAVTGIRVGGARGSEEEKTDSPLLRDKDGHPLIPGSSVKGVFRSAAERLLRPLEARRDERLACDVVSARCLENVRGRAPTDEELKSLCWTCRLFGNPFLGGRITAGDLVATTTTTIVRDGVGIDRQELKAARGLKFDYEVAPPGTRFTGRLRIDDPEPGDVGLVLALLDLVDRGLVTFGGGASRGLGQLRHAQPPVLTELRASTFVLGAEPMRGDVERERRRFLERIEAGAR